MFTLLCAISIQILKFFCKDRRLLLYMSRTLHLFGTDWCAMMVPIQVIRWYRMQCYDGTDSCATVVPIRRYCQLNQFGYLDDCDDNKSILQKIANNGVGYFIQPNTSMPYFPKRGLQIMTSLNKENKALGHNLASYTNMMLKSITFLLNNTLSINLNSFAYNQLEYPNVNHTEIDIDTILLQLISFDLERIVLSGEISCDKLERILNLAQTRNLLVIFRVHYLAYPIQHIQDMLRKYRTIMVELLIDSATPLDIINLREERLILKYIVKDSFDLDKLTGAKENIVLCPIFLDEKNITLQSQMVITKDEVLKINQNLKDCYLKDYINLNSATL